MAGLDGHLRRRLTGQFGAEASAGFLAGLSRNSEAARLAVPRTPTRPAPARTGRPGKAPSARRPASGCGKLGSREACSCRSRRNHSSRPIHRQSPAKVTEILVARSGWMTCQLTTRRWHAHPVRRKLTRQFVITGALPCHHMTSFQSAKIFPERGRPPARSASSAERRSGVRPILLTLTRCGQGPSALLGCGVSHPGQFQSRRLTSPNGPC